MAAKLAAGGAAFGLACGAYAYAACWPGSQLFGKTLIASRDPAQIALTFDDGPNGDVTLKLLDVLAGYQVRASFFMIGNFVRRQPALVRSVRDAGHLIGNHTMSHPSLLWQSPRRVLNELLGCNHALEDTLGEPVRYFRPPHGTRRPDVLRTVQSLGLTPVMWNITCFDWSQRDANVIARRAQRGVGINQWQRRGSTVLLHDGGHKALGTDRSATVSATDMLLRKLAGAPAHFVTPDDWPLA